MRPVAQGYFLKEYGSWSVLIISFVIGTGVSRAFSWALIPLFLSLSLLINSKQALMKWMRRSGDRAALAVFLAQAVVAGAIMLTLFRSSIPLLLPLLVVPAAYLLSSKVSGEHAIVTELLGFALLSLAAVLAKVLLTGGVDVRLFVAVALYFTAGVFKVKTVLLKKMRDRILTVLYIAFSVYLYRRFHLPVIALLPLVDNLVMAAVLYKVRLQTTGWIEVAKSLLFMALLLFSY